MLHCNVQALKQQLEDLPAAEIEPLLLAWTPTFQRLVMDNARWLSCFLQDLSFLYIIF